MSIQSEIIRLGANVTAALNAVENKGVAVPAGSKSDDLPALIAEIQTGVDTSQDTVTPEVLASGYTAHNAAGEQITGTYVQTYEVFHGVFEIPSYGYLYDIDIPNLFTKRGGTIRCFGVIPMLDPGPFEEMCCGISENAIYAYDEVMMAEYVAGDFEITEDDDFLHLHLTNGNLTFGSSWKPTTARLAFIREF